MHMYCTFKVRIIAASAQYKLQFHALQLRRRKCEGLASYMHAKNQNLNIKINVLHNSKIIDKAEFSVNIIMSVKSFKYWDVLLEC